MNARGDQQLPEGGDPLMLGFRLKGYKVLPNQKLVVPPKGEPVKLENKVMAVLVELARRPYQTVSEQTFMDTVWANRVVTPQVLSRNIHLARAALGDNAERSEFIRTIPNEGYQLVVDVMPLARARKRLYVVGAAMALVLIVAVIVSVVSWQSAEQPAKVAVIPFTAPDLDRLPVGGESLADHLISVLTTTDAVDVVARRDAYAIPKSNMDVASIGEKLGADYLVNGHISLQGEQLNLTMTLTDTEEETDVWSEVIEGDPERPGQLQAAALAALSRALVRELGIPPLGLASPPQSIDETAYELYLRAQYNWNLRGARRIDAAIDLNRQAIERSPRFAAAHLELARALAIKPFYSDERIGSYFADARKTLEMVESLTSELDSEVDALQGFMYMEERRWAEAKAHLLEALAQDADNALAHYWYSYLLSNFGDFETALEEIRLAAALNPNSAVINDRLALSYLWVNDTESALRAYDAAVELGYLESNQVKPAVLLAVRTQKWDTIRNLLLRLGFDSDWVDAFVRGLAEPAYRSEATARIQAAIDAGEVSREFWFGIWVLYQDADRAFAAFDLGEKSQDIELLWAAESEFLRADPRFHELVALAGLTEFAAEYAPAAEWIEP